MKLNNSTLILKNMKIGSKKYYLIALQKNLEDPHIVSKLHDQETLEICSYFVKIAQVSGLFHHISLTKY